MHHLRGTLGLCGRTLRLHQAFVLRFDGRILRPQKAVGLYVGRSACFQLALSNADLGQQQPVLEAQPPCDAQQQGDTDNPRALNDSGKDGRQRGTVHYDKV